MSDGIRVTSLIAPKFWPVHHAVKTGQVAGVPKTHFWLKGGRGSLKSSFVAIQLVLMMLRHDDCNVVVLRKVANTLRDSVYEQVLWAIGLLGVSHLFHASVSPMEIVHKASGRKIMFRGADKAEKLKSVKVRRGYVRAAWFEELDQFRGMNEVRNIRQSLMRGGDDFAVFYSYNPPKSRDSWVNKEALIVRPDRYVHDSTYLDAPREWLGEVFIAEAEELLRTEGKTDAQIEKDKRAYDHEYLGDVTGTGGAVFENVVTKTLTDEEVAAFDRTYNGVDFGYFPDPWLFERCYFQAAQRRLVIFDEASAYRKGNSETAEIIKGHLGQVRDGDGRVTKHPRYEVVQCDSAEPKSIADYREEGLDARNVGKGPGSVEHGMKWLQSLAEIVIDPARCPVAAQEFMGYEYERTPDGDYCSGYPDAENHSIDAVRYAMAEVIARRHV